jgi:hypothetical protein
MENNIFTRIVIFEKHSLFNKYNEWFKTEFDCLPEEKYLGLKNIDELVSIRNEPFYKHEAAKLKILTFKEFKQNYYENKKYKIRIC